MPTVPNVTELGRPTPYGNPDAAVNVANREIDAANGYINSLGRLVGGMAIPVINADFPQVGVAPPLSVLPPPTLETITWISPPFPDPTDATVDISDILPQPFDGVAPTLTFAGLPADFIGVVPDAPGIDVTYDYPTLSVSLPAPPSLLSISVSKFDGVTIPSFDATVPELTAVAPSVINYIPGSLYTSGLLTSMRTSLQDRIDNGGTGLAPDVENAIWDRGREREARQARDAIAALDQMESLGYSFPPGVYVDARIKIQTEMGYNASNISREIMIEQAKLEQTNVLQALAQANEIEGKLVAYQNQTEQRRFEAAKYATDAAVEIYNAKVKAYSSYVDAYRVKATVYEAQVRGEIAKVEAYKATIQAEEAKAQVNTALVQQYKVQADVALSNIEIFKAQIAGIQAKAEVEKLKISIYGEEIKAYIGQINAYTSRVEAYKATISAEATKQEAFRSQVQAYAAEVDVQVKVAQARIEEFKGKIAGKQAEYDGYRARVQAESARVQGIASSNQSVIEGYKADVQGISSYNETVTKQWQSTIEIATQTAQVNVSIAKANAELYVTARQIAIEASKVGAQVSAQLGAAALNAVSFSNSTSFGVSNSSSRAGSASDSQSKSTSESDSKSENHNYNASV